MKQVRKNEPEIFCTSFKKGSENRSSRFEPKILWVSFSRGSGPPLKNSIGQTKKNIKNFENMKEKSTKKRKKKNLS